PFVSILFCVPKFAFYPKNISGYCKERRSMGAPKLKPSPGKRYRLITRSDMDGLVCAVLLKELNIIDDISFAHPKDMQDGLIDIDDDVITTNLPYVEGVYMAFDHHASEVSRVGSEKGNHVITP